MNLGKEILKVVRRQVGTVLVNRTRELVMTQMSTDLAPAAKREAVLDKLRRDFQAIPGQVVSDVMLNLILEAVVLDAKAETKAGKGGAP
jgi:hypothetical protein